MDPVTAALIAILILIVIGGVWGTMVISALLKRRSPEALTSSHQARLEGVLEDHRQLEARLGQLEEEVGFLRALREPEQGGLLPSADGGEAG